MRALLSLALLVAVLGALPGCGDDPPRAPGPDAAILRARAAALFADENFAAARETLAPLLELAEPAAIDLLAGGILALELGDRPAALALVGRALAADPEDPAAHYVHARLLEQEGDTDGAIRHFREALARAPDDQPTRLALAWRLTEAGQPEEAEALYREFLARGVAHTGSWHLMGLHQYAMVLYRTGRDAEGERLLAEKATLEGQGLTVPSSDDSQRGTFGRLRAPAPVPPAAVTLPALASRPVSERRLALAGVAHLLAATLVDEWVHLPEGGCRIGRSDLLAWGEAGVFRLPAGAGAPERLAPGPVEILVAFDADNDRDLDLLLLGSEGARLLLAGEAGFAAAPFDLPALPEGPRAALAGDYDHDGDLDLALVGRFGLRLWRNDGVGVEGGRFEDATAAALGRTLDPLDWVLAEDFDTDQDVDLLVGSAEDLWLLSNLRAGRFEVLEPTGVPPSARRYLAADFDADGRPDLVSVEQGRLWLGRPGRAAFVPGPSRPGVGPTQRARVGDLDSDGRLDVVWLGARAAGVSRAAGLPGARDDDLGGAGSIDALGVDAAGTGAPQLLLLRADGLAVRPVAPQGRGFRLALRGIKDNARGVGAVVEVRAGALYQRLYWRGEPRWIGLGSETKADVVRITWPNGVVQHDLDTPAGCERLIEQAEGLVGSCPFLYAWNGRTYEFVTDVLGITPMGLPMAPGMLVPPDHDEFVRIRGEQLVPRTLEDGRAVYEVQLTEELREVTYLDRVKLLVVDHPEGTEMEPNERFTFPPFPEPRIHVLAACRAPRRALGSDGRDWAEELGAIDGRYAAPFTPYRGQWLGLAPAHTLELAFDPAGLAEASELRLAMTGWFYWTDASVNMATARTPGVDFVPPILQVPDPEGGPGAWKDVGPPVGFPAGKTKTMVLDVGAFLRRDDPRLRIVTTLRLYWDSIRLCVGEDAESAVTEIEPESAWLWERGFSRPVFLGGAHRLEWFDWDQLDAPRWNQHPGMYTRYGDVLPLVQAIDDCFVILGAGDALRLRFDATGVPAPRPGWRRDFLLFLDGWAKDRDPNTLEALSVEPLPFHGMTSYPYAPGQRYPDTAQTRAYRAEWNTRHARRWIPPLAPPGEGVTGRRGAGP